jgi:hypothetical protein
VTLEFVVNGAGGALDDDSAATQRVCPELPRAAQPRHSHASRSLYALRSLHAKEQLLRHYGEIS